MTWADATVWRAVHALTQAENDSRLRLLLHHIHLVQHAFLGLWSGSPLEFRQLSDFRDLASISAWGHEYHRNVGTFIAKTAGAFEPDQTVEIPWAERFESQIGHPPGPTTLAETMIHVTAHSTYHRGQVNARVRELEGDPPLVDFIAWAWAGKPHVEWPALPRR